MKQAFTLSFLLLLYLYTAYSQNVPKLKVIKKDVIKANHSKYDVTYWSMGGLDLINHNFNLPKIKNEDQILFDQESRNVRVDRDAIADAVARVITQNKSKINKSEFKRGMNIGMRFFVDSNNFGLLFIEFYVKVDQYTDLHFFKELEDGLKSEPVGKLMRITGNIIPRIKAYGYLTSGTTIRYDMLKDKVEL
ncbi:hypothetical protein [Mucilaginibacter sp. PAMB04168]|uniref:hypothetical protein n=1 Tax=Mucilaginibacter sp. PAMB04168 TaxID=3138567 RepID=UPI0031F6D1DB